MKFLHKIDNIISKIEEVFLIIFFSIMLVLGFLQVMLRNFFGSGFMWADPLLRHLVLWVGLIGASLATKHEKHINMDALSRVISPKVKHIAEIFLNIIASIIGLAFIYAGYLFVKYEYEDAKTVFLGVPSWLASIIIPLAFTVITIRFCLKGIEKIVTLFKKEEKEN